MNGCNRIKDSLKSLDFFGVPIGFNVNQSNSFKSVLGGVAFILFAVPVFYYMFSLAIMTFKMDKYVLNIYSEVDPNEKKVIISKEANFELGFYFSSSSPQFDLNDFEFTLLERTNQDGYGKNNFSDNIIPIVECTSTAFGGRLKDRTAELFCPDTLNHKNTLFIEAGSQFQHSHSVVVKIRPASHTSIDELKLKYLNEFVYFNYVTSDQQINYLATEDNLSPVPSIIKCIIDFDQLKRFVMFFEKVDCEFDNSIIWKQKDSFSFTRISWADPYHQMRQPENSDLLVEMETGIEQRVVKIIRRFYKLEELLSDAGGIFSNVVIIFWFFVSMFNEKQAYYSILNRVFQFNNLIRQSKNIQLAKEYIDDTEFENNFKPKVTRRACYTNPANTWNILRSSLCFCLMSKRTKKMYLLYDKGKTYIDHYLNVITYINKIHQISLLKDVILSQNQKIALRFLAKPQISEYQMIKEKEEIQEFKTDALNDDEMFALKVATDRMNRRRKGTNKRLLRLVKRKVDFMYKELFNRE